MPPFVSTPLVSTPPKFLTILLFSLGLTTSVADAKTVEPDSPDSLTMEAPDLIGPYPKILGLIERGQSDKAITLLNARLYAGENSAVLQELLGLAYAKTGKIDKSLAAFAASIELDDKRPSAYTNLGLLQKAIGRLKAAEASFRKALSLDGNDRRAHQNLGLFAEARGNVAQAIRHFEAGIRNTPPQYVGVKLDLARLYLKTNRPADAIKLLGRWEVRPDAPEPVMIVLADAHLALGQENRALDILKKLTENAKSPEAFVRLAKASIGKRQFPEAMQWLQKAREQFPEDPQVFFEIGNLYGAQKQYGKAVAAYESGLKIAPDNAALLHASSLANFRLGNMEKALDLSEKAVAKDGSNSGYLYWLGTLYQKNGDEDAAIKIYERAVALAPDNWIFLNNLAALLSDKDPARAVSLAGKAAKLAPDVGAVQDTLGWASFRNGDLQGAVRIFAQLTEKEPENAHVAYRLGKVLSVLGNQTSARAALERALTLDPEADFAKDARKILEQF